MSTFSLVWFALIGVTISVFWLIRARWRFPALSLATLAVVAFADPVSALILIALAFSTWFYTRDDTGLSGPRAAFAVGLPILVLLLIKIASASRGDDVVSGTIVPLGLAFYALRAAHFSFERYLGRIEPQRLASVLQYLFFLPTFLVGPIHRFPEFERDLRRHRWHLGMFYEGLERLLYGAFKIAVLGNFITWRLFGNFIEDHTQSGTPLNAYFTMVLIGLNLYFQFSGASDIAIGFARCLGIRVMENFNWPFFSTSIPDFWRRWHISLTSLVREYFYAGIAAFSRNPRLAALATMLAIGLWHEVSMRYVLWGLYHGVGIALWQSGERQLRQSVKQHAIYKLSGWVITMHFVFFGFYFVRLPDPLGSMIGLIVK